MTKEEKLKIFEEAEDRCYEALKSAEPGKDMDYILENLGSLHWRANVIRNPDPDTFACTGKPNVLPEPDKESQNTEEPAPGGDKESQNTEEPAPGGNEEPKITKEEVRKKLAVFQTSSNLDVATLMQSMGYSKLSEVPASRYWELLEKAQKIVDGGG